MLQRAIVLCAIAIALAAGATGQPGMALPPPVEQSGADCAAPTYASDQLVCGDAELLALDRQMLAALHRAGQTAIEPRSPLLEAQSAWFARRSLCAMRSGHRGCLQQAYRERIAVLEGLVVNEQPSVPTLVCGKGGLAVRLKEVSIGALVIDRVGATTAVALTQAGDASGWRPFLALIRSGRRISLTPLGGRTIPCKQQRASD